VISGTAAGTAGSEGVSGSVVDTARVVVTDES
jgi:hypothetical protein